MSRADFDEKRGISGGRVCLYVGLVLLLFLVAAVLAGVFLTRSGKEPASLFGYSAVAVTSEDMGKSIPAGSLAIVKLMELDNSLKGNDAAVFREGFDSKGNVILGIHRIWAVNSAEETITFQTKSDTNPEPDETLRPAEEAIGRVEFMIPYAGSFLLFVKTPLGLICCVAIPLLILLLVEIINLIRLPKSEQSEEEEETLPSYMQLGEDFMEPTKKSPAETLLQENLPFMEGKPSMKEGFASTQAILDSINGSTLLEEQHETLELVEPPKPFQSISYTKPATPPVETPQSSLYSTREFQLPASVRTPFKPLSQATQEQKAPLTPPEPPQAQATQAQFAPTQFAPAQSTTEKKSFAANLHTQSPNQFQIEGVDVKVQEDTIRLVFDEQDIKRDISITVTKDYTNVTVDSKDCEVNFALFKEDGDEEQKVIIQKKGRTTLQP